MKRSKRLSFSILIALGGLALLFSNVHAKKSKKNSKQRYALTLCDTPRYHCIKVKRGDTWRKLWPNPEIRDLLMRLNRTNMRIYPGMKLVVPHKIENLTIWDISPFPRYVEHYKGQTVILIDQNKLAWGAYDADGELQWWGPISSGKDYCHDIRGSCRTITGGFYVFNKDGKGCESNVFPVGRGGADMPYCMFFYRGFALHGSNEVPGYRDSHGCVRMFTKDAKWLNQSFIQLPSRANNYRGTKVVVQDIE